MLELTRPSSRQSPLLVLLITLIICGNVNAQCGINEPLSDAEFIEILEDPTNSCYNVLFKEKRIESIKRMDRLMSDLGSAVHDENFTPVNSVLAQDVAEKINKESISSEKGKTEIKEEVAVDYMMKMAEALITFTGMHSDTYSLEVPEYLSYLTESSTVQQVYFDYEFKMLNDGFEGHPLAPNTMENNLEEIAIRLDKLEEMQYSMYQSNSSYSHKIKGIQFYHENDVFLIPVPINQDREMTGAFKVAVSTDYFKARFLNAGWIFSGLVFGSKSNRDKSIERIKHPRNQVVSYQTLSAGGFGYTPYIRYHNNYGLADTFHQHDRPFGSYLYIERAKYRLWPRGLVRHVGQFQIGQVGLLSGDKIQATIHKDLTVKSQRVYGWTKQIGNGGRSLFQLNHKLDLLLFSNTNRYRSIFSYKKAVPDSAIEKSRHGDNIYTEAYGKLNPRYGGVNISSEFDLQFGGYITSVGGGFRFSTLDFKHQSGQKYIVARRRGVFDFGWHFDAGIGYRYVIHNSMLEGFGIWQTFERDPYDEENIDVYKLNAGQINRHLLMADWGITFRWRQMCMYLRHTYHTLEYRVNPIDYEHPDILALVDPDDLESYRTKWVKEHQSIYNQKFYGYGMVGASWYFN